MSSVWFKEPPEESALAAFRCLLKIRFNGFFLNGEAGVIFFSVSFLAAFKGGKMIEDFPADDADLARLFLLGVLCPLTSPALEGGLLA